MSDQLRAQIARVLASLRIDRNDEAARTKVKTQLESDIPDSNVLMFAASANRPSCLMGSLSHPSLSKPLHFEVVAPPAEFCLVCGEALDHVKVYGCVAGVQDCVYETLH